MNQSQLIPNASINGYYQYWLKDIPKNCDRGIVGYVRNTTNEDLVIGIEIDDVFMEERNHPNMCFYLDDKNFISGCLFVITSSFFQDLYNNDYLLASIWHEVGHFHTTHYFNTSFNNTSTIQQRTKYYEQGKVMEEEQAADLFSLYYTSKEQWLNDIRYFIKKRYNQGWDQNRFMAVNEMRDRRSLIKKIESEKKKKNSLCKLCKVDCFENI